MKRENVSNAPLTATAAALKYTEIVIGNSLEAAIHAFTERIPLIYTKFQEPHRFDRFPVGTDLNFIGIGEEIETQHTHEDVSDVGTPKSILWRRLMFLLSMEGLAPMSDLCHNIRLDSEKIICSNEYSKIAEIEFTKAYYYGDASSTGFVNKVLAPSSYKCYDWIGFNRGGKHNIDLIRTEDDLANEIWFYASDRIDGNSPVKDACVISYLTAEQLSHFDYSETMARFKTVHEMEQRGMLGPSNGYGSNGKLKRYRIKTFCMDRTLEPITAKPKSLSEKIIVQEPPNLSTLITSLRESAPHYQKLIDNTNE
jgi:hypothetical protein